MLKWKKHKPHFEFVSYGDSSVEDGHFEFIYDMVRNMKPNLMVELGSGKSETFFSMCQAIKDDGFPAQVVTVGGWQKNSHWEVSNTDKSIKDFLYQNIGHLVSSNAKEASNLFINESIELLHIDSSLSYTSISKDYELWLEKVKPGGAVLVHNIKESGIASFWGEVKRKYPSLEFGHSGGLGVFYPKGVPTHLLYMVLDDKKTIQGCYSDTGS